MKTTILSSTFVLGLLAALSVVGCANGELVDETSAPCSSEEKSNILDTAIKAGSFTVLARAIEAADLSEMLRGAGPFTVFAPTDEAFSRLPAGTLDRLLLPENKEELRSLLLGHIASGRLDSSRIASMNAIPMLAGQPTTVESSQGETTVGGVALANVDIVAGNGLIHIIGALILPQEPVVNPEEPVVNPQEPVNQPQEPGAQLREPATSQEEPASVPEEPAAPPVKKQGKSGRD